MRITRNVSCNRCRRSITSSDGINIPLDVTKALTAAGTLANSMPDIDSSWRRETILLREALSTAAIHIDATAPRAFVTLEGIQGSVEAAPRASVPIDSDIGLPPGLCTPPSHDDTDACSSSGSTTHLMTALSRQKM